MRRSILLAMWWSILRDRAALLMAFVLPGLFFVIMAEIYTAATGARLNLEVVVVDEMQSAASQRLVTALSERPNIQVHALAPDAVRTARALVKAGTMDVGLWLRAGAEPLVEPSGFGAAPLVIMHDPARGATVPLLAGHLRAAYFGQMPDVALGNVVAELEQQFLTLTEEQRSELADGLAEMRADAAAGLQVGGSFDDLLTEGPVAGGDSVHLVAYSAGAVAFMFLLFSSMHGAISLQEEQDSGILDRVLAGPGGIGVLIDGKFLFLLLQGSVQVTVIFVIAWLAYDVPLFNRFGAFVVVTGIAASAAAGFTLLVAAACRTRRQAQTIANTVILVMSALGGSMVPRFFMPTLLKDLGWLTPNTWALEAYSGVFWHNDALLTLWLPLTLLLALGLACWIAARYLAHRRLFA